MGLGRLGVAELRVSGGEQDVGGAGRSRVRRMRQCELCFLGAALVVAAVVRRAGILEPFDVGGLPEIAYFGCESAAEGGCVRRQGGPNTTGDGERDEQGKERRSAKPELSGCQSADTW